MPPAPPPPRHRRRVGWGRPGGDATAARACPAAPPSAAARRQPAGRCEHRGRWRRDGRGRPGPGRTERESLARGRSGQPVERGRPGQRLRGRGLAGPGRPADRSGAARGRTARQRLSGDGWQRLVLAVTGCWREGSRGAVVSAASRRCSRTGTGDNCQCPQAPARADPALAWAVMTGRDGRGCQAAAVRLAMNGAGRRAAGGESYSRAGRSRHTVRWR